MSWSTSDLVGQTGWYGNPLRGHWVLIPCSCIMDICSLPEVLFEAPVLVFIFYFFLFQRLKYWDEQQQQQHPSSLVPLRLSFPSLPPGGLLGEQLSHHLLPLLILYLLLLLLPPPSFCFAFAADGDNLCHFPGFTFNPPAEPQPRECMCVHFFLSMHLAEFMFVRFCFFILSASISSISHSY